MVKHAELAVIITSVAHWETKIERLTEYIADSEIKLVEAIRFRDAYISKMNSEINFLERSKSERGGL